MSWEMVDEGWGRKAVDFACFEPGAGREYVRMHHALALDAGDRVLDVACGSGFALEMAAARGATCAGIDAANRLVAVAQDRLPDADIRVGDMCAMPWDDATFDVVTSFRGIWGTTPDAIAEAFRVLRPGGRIGMTVWGDVRKSPGGWTFLPFTWATAEQVEHQAEMVSLGRPGVGERFLADAGFAPDERFEITFVIESADPELFARQLAATGPAYEAIQQIGEQAFLDRTSELAAGFVRDGLPLRGEIQLFGYTATKPT